MKWLYFVTAFDFAAFIKTTMRTSMMRTHHFTALRAFTHAGWNNPVMGSPHIPLGCTGFSLWNCHILLLLHQR